MGDRRCKSGNSEKAFASLTMYLDASGIVDWLLFFDDYEIFFNDDKIRI